MDDETIENLISWNLTASQLALAAKEYNAGVMQLKMGTKEGVCKVAVIVTQGDDADGISKAVDLFSDLPEEKREKAIAYLKGLQKE